MLQDIDNLMRGWMLDGDAEYLSHHTRPQGFGIEAAD
jgi:hypothetical protein